MKSKILNLIDFEKVNILLEGFNKSTGFVTAILDLDGNVLSQSGWRQICSNFHRVHPETAKRCTESDTLLAGKMGAGEKYHYYKCLNGLIDVAVPIIIQSEHVANLFSGQFFFEKPDRKFFENQAIQYKFDQTEYLNALDSVPVVSEEKVKTAMDFLLNMTQLISDMTLQKLEQDELNETLGRSEERLRLALEGAIADSWEMNLVTGELFYSDQWARHLGYEPGDIPYTIEGTSRILHPDDIASNQKNLDAYLNGHKPVYETETRILKKDSTYAWLLSRGKIIERDKTGNPVRLIGTNVDITERKQAEDALQESEQKFRTITENSPDSIIIHDQDMNILDANLKTVKDFGYSKMELLKMKVSELHPESEQKHSKQVLDTLKKENLSDVETEFVRKDGSVFTAQVAPSKYSIGGKQIIHVVIKDITERKLTDDALRISEDKFRSIYEQSPIAIQTYDMNGKLLGVNQKTLDLFGLTDVKYVLGFNLWEDPNLSPDKREALKKGKSIYILASFNFESVKEVIQFPSKRTGIIYLDMYVVPLIRGNETTGFLVHIIEITNQKINEEKLKVSEEKFRVLYHNSPDMYVSVSPDDATIVLCNDTLLIETGYTKDEVVGAPIFKMYHNDCMDDVKKVFRQFIETGKIKNRELILKRKDGSKIDVSLNVDAIKDETGKILYSMSSWRDISKSKQVKLDLIKAKEKAEESEGKLKVALASMSDAIFISDQEGNFIDFNEAFATFHKFKNKEECAKTLKEYPVFLDVFDLDGEFVPLEMWVVPRALRGEIGLNKEYVLKRKETGETWIGSYNYSPIRNNEGDITGSVVTARDITDLKKDQEQIKIAKEKAEKSEEKFRGVFEQSPLAIEIYDREGKLIEVNQKTLDIFGVNDRKYVLGFDLWADPNLGSEKMTELKNGKSIFISSEFDFEIVKKKKLYPTTRKGIMYMDMYAIPLIQEKDIIGFLVQILDVSEQKKAEDALKNSENKYRLLIENLPQRVFSKDLKHRFISCNHNFAADLDLTQESIIGKTDFDIFPKDLAEKYQKDDRRIIKTGQMEELDEEYIQQGQRKIIHTIKTPMLNENDEIIGIMGIFWDVTEIRKTEEEINKLTRLLKETGKMAKIGGWEFNTHTGEGTWTEEVARIHELEPNQPTNMDMGLSFYTPESRIEIEEAIKKAISHSKSYDLELEMITPKGNHKWVRTIGQPTRTGGKVTRIHGSFQDITEKKKIEKELISYQKHLETLVSERTQNLKEKNEELERMNKVFIGRELKMVELKERIKKLEEKI